MQSGREGAREGGGNTPLHGAQRMRKVQSRCGKAGAPRRAQGRRVQGKEKHDTYIAPWQEEAPASVEAAFSARATSQQMPHRHSF